MAGSRWRQSHPLVESELVLDIAVKPKAVRFEIGAIWAGREQVDGDEDCAVACYRKIERFCQARDLHKGRDATAIGDVGLRIGHGDSRDIVLELPERAQVFAGRDRHAAGSHDAGVTGNIIGNGRLF